MDPNVWGKHGWIFLHSITMAYPDKPSEKDKLNYKNFFHLLMFVLPCDVCREHFKQYISEIPIDNALHSKKKLVEWLINIHNKTNESLGKPVLNYIDVIDIYKNLYSESEKNEKNIEKKNNKNENNYYSLIAIILGIILISIFIWKKKNVLFV
jgi:hypothetical protein